MGETHTPLRRLMEYPRGSIRPIIAFGRIAGAPLSLPFSAPLSGRYFRTRSLMRQIYVIFTKYASFMSHMRIRLLAGFDYVKNTFPHPFHIEKIPVDQVFEVPPGCRRRYTGKFLVIRIGDLPGIFREEHCGDLTA